MSNIFVYGIHAVRALLQARPDLIRSLAVQANRQDERLNQLIALAEKHKISIRPLSRQELTQLAKQAEHQGVVAECEALPQYQESDLACLVSSLPKPGLILVLDGVQDPHNLGACLRSADAFGVSLVIIPKNNSVAITPVVRKVACGAAETIPLVTVTNLARSLELLKEHEYWLVGTAAEAEESIAQIDFKMNTVLVMGGEGSGLRRLTKESCDYLASIPMQGSVSSLNVSVATAVCLYEIQRQRLSLGVRPAK
ncbi:MAG TPA: 23S rRNA (guanosine(2251)-2'-O)-methyltransferase RlmB [Coxiellaceae bacterium]|nr:23S rRNA (guanosine(2251)-2'-O)-methyltransferase RlmB [Coxiellaceae bacterium]